MYKRITPAQAKQISGGKCVLGPEVCGKKDNNGRKH